MSGRKKADTAVSPKMGRRPNEIPTVRVAGYLLPTTAAEIEAKQKELRCTWGQAVDALVQEAIDKRL